jgi:hypothetical protein
VNSARKYANPALGAMNVPINAPALMKMTAIRTPENVNALDSQDPNAVFHVQEKTMDRSAAKSANAIQKPVANVSTGLAFAWKDSGAKIVPRKV